MANEYLRYPLDPYKFCAAEREAVFDLSLQDMKRAQEMLVDAEGSIHFELRFSYGPQRLLQVEGRLKGDVTLECQRCLGPVQESLDSEFMWGLVTTEEAASNLPRTHEPVFIENEALDLLPAIEDELILALPLVAYHPPEACSMPEQITGQAPEETQAPVEKHNPFSALADLKKSLKSGQ
ncbi:YceD family protein [Marinospirillum alkaliphilum]|uniref:Large ribosomal RNA subunit accumulation protein YceD n=1 Tax=Marinospirillum alkaliphilum DSM 21637 TaxID=1122209 RepID=A0A1K1X6U1_9GAMM|nr:YceD family protein [Marinospirillum alkaliphilum]SFX45378.1 uncharacterized protein SAMN02745752_01749 [Marinospirillum alkaliphilum DSM 21637]